MMIEFERADLEGLYSLQVSQIHTLDEQVSENQQKRTVYDYGALGFSFRCRFRFFGVDKYRAFLARLMAHGQAAQYALPLGSWRRALPTLTDLPDESGYLDRMNAGQSLLAAAAGVSIVRNLNVQFSGVIFPFQPGQFVQFSHQRKLYKVTSTENSADFSVQNLTISPPLWLPITGSVIQLTPETAGSVDFLNRAELVKPVVRLNQRRPPAFKRAVDGWFTADINFIEDATPD